MATVDLQPTLDGRLTSLRPLRADDFDALYAVASDPEIWVQHPANDRWQKDVFRHFFDDAIKGKAALVVIDKASGKIIGSSRYHGYSKENDEVEIGWTFLAREFWGGAVNRDLKHLMIEHALGFVSNVVFRVGVTNWRSQRAMEKIGGSKIGTQPDAAGNESYIYRIRHADFKQHFLAGGDK